MNQGKQSKLLKHSLVCSSAKLGIVPGDIINGEMAVLENFQKSQLFCHTCGTMAVTCSFNLEGYNSTTTLYSTEIELGVSHDQPAL